MMNKAQKFKEWTVKHLTGEHAQKRHGYRGGELREDRPEVDEIQAASGKVPVENIKVVKVWDHFRVSGAPREIIGVNQFGDEQWGYSDEAYTPDFMIQSQETKRWLRWAAKLSDGRIVSLDGAIRITDPKLWDRMTRTAKKPKIADIGKNIPPNIKVQLALETTFDSFKPGDVKLFALDKLPINKASNVSYAVLREWSKNENPARFGNFDSLYPAVKAAAYKKAIGKYPWEMEIDEFIELHTEYGSKQHDYYANKWDFYLGFAALNSLPVLPGLERTSYQNAIKYMSGRYSDPYYAERLEEIKQLLSSLG